MKKCKSVVPLLLAAVLLVLGLAQGQAREVMAKAILVCLECIGIG